MVSAKKRIVLARPIFKHRRPAELAAPDDDGFIEQAALLEVEQERRRGAVGLVAPVDEPVQQPFARAGAVGIPSPVKQLHEPHPAFDEPARQQAVVGEGGLARFGAVEGVD